MATKAPVLSPAQENLLLLVGDGCVSAYPPRGSEGPTFAVFDRGALARAVKCQSPTGTGRSLIRLGLIESRFPPPRGSGRALPVCAELTSAGREIFDSLLTPAQRSARDRHAQDLERSLRMRRERDTEAAFRERHRAAFDAHRDRQEARRAERQALERERAEIANALGRGANDVGDLLARLRQTVARIDAILDEDARDEATLPRHEPFRAP